MLSRVINAVKLSRIFVVALAMALFMVMVVLTGRGPVSAIGTLPFSEPFGTDTADTATTLATYTDWSRSVTGGTASEVVVQSGQVNMSPTGPAVFTLFDIAGFSGDLIITADIGANAPGNGSFSVGLSIGDERLVFQPGRQARGTRGFFRVDGPDGFNNDDMGFLPATNVLHHVEVTITAATGVVNIQVTDANNSANIYAASYTDTNYDPGVTRIGFTIEGSVAAATAGATGFYDNFGVTGVVELSCQDGAAGGDLVGYWRAEGNACDSARDNHGALESGASTQST